MRMHVVFLISAILTTLGPATHPVEAQDSKENGDFKLAINLFNDGLNDLALEQFKQYINTFPNTPQGIDARFYLGLTELKLKKFEDARLTFQTFALTYQDNPKAPDAWWNVGESYAAVKMFKDAALAYERVKVFHPKSKLAPDALLKATRFFLLGGERDNAHRTLREILQEYPNSSAALAARTQLGQLYFEEGNYEQAQNELKRVIEGDPLPDARAGALLVLGNISQAMGRTDNAQSDYREIIAKYPSSSAVGGAYVNLGKLLAAAGKYAEALDCFRKAPEQKSIMDSTVIHDALIGSADAQAALAEYSAAVSSYERYLLANPQSERTAEVLWKLATAASHAKNYQKSNDACGRLLKSDAPELLKHRARLKLASNAEEQKNFAVALQQYEAFTDANPEDAATPKILLRAAAMSADKLHDDRKAAAVYEQTATRYPSSPAADDALAGAARSYERMKEFDRALQSYRELIAKYPASEFRAEADARIRQIETFEAKEKDAGLEKLALLVGDMVAEKDKAGLAYRLGDIYFSDLKSYAAAATQFTNALEAGLNDSRAADAIFKRAKSLEYLSWTDTHYAPTAIEAYRAYLLTAGRDSDEATLAVFRLSATTLPAARHAAEDVLKLVVPFARRDIIHLTLGKLFEQADSIAPAASEYAAAARTTQDPVVAEEAAYRSVCLLLTQGLADSALAEGAQALATYPAGPHTADLLSRLGDLALQQHKAPTAVPLYRQLMGAFGYTSQAASAREKLAQALAADGETDAAIAAYSGIYHDEVADPMTDGQPEPAILLALGRLHMEAGSAAEAKRFLTEILKKEQTGPIAGEAYTTLGMIYRTEGLRDAATSYFRQAEAAAPGTSVSRDIADLLFDNGDYADAIKQYTQLTETAADSERQYYAARIIVALFRSDDPAHAEKNILAFGKTFRDSNDDMALFELEKGLYLFRQEDYAPAMKAFERVADSFEDSPSAPSALYWIGKTLEAMDKQTEAIDHLEKLLTTHPQAPIIPRVHFALGNLYYNAEKWSEAIKNYRMVVDDPQPDPELLPSAISNLIETYETAGAYDGALTLTRKYLELYPNAEDALDKKIKIGILYGRLGYYDQAVLHLQSLLDEAGSDLEGEIRYYIAESNYNKGDYQQAILDFLKVPYLVTKKGKIDWTANSLYMSGQSYEKMGRYDQALTMYQQIIDRTGIDETFKSAARKEIDRVKTVLKRKPN